MSYFSVDGHILSVENFLTFRMYRSKHSFTYAIIAVLKVVFRPLSFRGSVSSRLFCNNTETFAFFAVLTLSLMVKKQSLGELLAP